MQSREIWQRRWGATRSDGNGCAIVLDAVERRKGSKVRRDGERGESFRRGVALVKEI